MPNPTTDPPIWPGPGYRQYDQRQRTRPAPNRAIGPERTPQRYSSGRPPTRRPPVAVIVIALVSLLLITALGFFAVRLHNAGNLGGSPGVDALSPDLAAYVAKQGGDMGVQVYDVTHGRSYASNADTTYILASSTKVYLMLADLSRIEAQGQPPGANDTQLLTAMIEHSNNDAAQTIYQQIGFDQGMRRYMATIGVGDYVPCSDGWGCARASAADMVHALTLLDKGQILTADDRQLALGLMREIEADQRMGAGETAPSGATVYMKDGWLNYPDPTLWNLNTSGIIVAGKETYILSVYSQNQSGEDWSKVDHVCALVAKALAS
jgi:hypothetical protein